MARHNKSMAFYETGTLTTPQGEKIPVMFTHIEGGLSFEENPRFASWFEFNDRFAYDDRMNGHFTARKEQRKAGRFWYAKATIGDKTVSQYIGKEITPKTLAAAATEFRRLRRFEKDRRYARK